MKFTNALKCVVGETGSVQCKIPKTTLEIRDLDSQTTEAEVLMALKNQDQTKTEDAKIRLTKPNKSELVMAIIEVSKLLAMELLKTA